VTRFFDTSAVVAAYAEEERSDRTRSLLSEGGVAVSRLIEVETVSALARLTREASISEAQRDEAVAAFLADLGGWDVVEVVPDVTAQARALLLRHPLRAADALQLSSALVLQSRLGAPLNAFVAFDLRIVEAARAERLAVSTE